MATFSTHLVCQTSGPPPDVGPVYLTYPVPDTLFEGVCVPTLADSGKFFGVAVGPGEHIFGNLYRVLVVVEGQFLKSVWSDPRVSFPGSGKNGYLLRQQ